MGSIWPLGQPHTFHIGRNRRRYPYSPTLCPPVSCLSGKMRFVAGGRWVPPRCKKKPGYRRACRPCLEPGDRDWGGASPASSCRGLHSLAGVVVRKGRNLLWISYTLYSGLHYSWDAGVLYRGRPAMPRKQLNVTLSPEQYAAVQEAGCRGGGEGGHLLPRGHPGPGDAGAGTPRRGHDPGLAAALHTICHQG